MSSKVWYINFCLVAVVIFLGIKGYGVLSEKKRWPSEIGLTKKPLPAEPEKSVSKKRLSPESDYEIIAQNNLFWIDRLESKPKQPAQKPKVEPKVDRKLLRILEQAFKLTNLYGVIVVNGNKEALIGDATAKRRKGVGERDVKRAKIGDTVGRFKVKEISNTSVVLVAGGREWQISLFDKDKPKKRAPLKKETGPIVIVGGSKMKSVLTDAKAVGKRPTPKPAVSKKETLPKAQNKKRTIPVPTDRSRTKKR